MSDEEKPIKVRGINFWADMAIITSIGGIFLAGAAASSYFYPKAAKNLFPSEKQQITKSQLILIDPVTKKLDTITIQDGPFSTDKNGWPSYTHTGSDGKDTIMHCPPNSVYKMFDIPPVDTAKTKASAPKPKAP